MRWSASALAAINRSRRRNSSGICRTQYPARGGSLLPLPVLRLLDQQALGGSKTKSPDDYEIHLGAVMSA